VTAPTPGYSPRRIRPLANRLTVLSYQRRKGGTLRFDLSIIVKRLALRYAASFILDLAFVPEGGTPADALRNTLDLAQHAEKWIWGRKLESLK
jgi:hypothetical protein